MGTNFSLITKSKEVRDKYFGYNYELTDTPDWGYEIHIAKTSMGWLPLFQAHDCFKSIRQLKELYDTGEFILADEYGTAYTWEEFDERVLQFNGGVKGVAPREKIEQDPHSRYYDRDLPEYKPISHFDYAHGRYSMDYFTDEDGYEFTTHEFS
jgi:hypothetical protein